MEQPGRSQFHFGPCAYDPKTRGLVYGRTRLTVPLQESIVLRAFLEQPATVLSKAIFAELLWPGQHYGDFDRAITNLISKVRRLHPEAGEWIETVPKAGYRFLLDVHCEAGSLSAPENVPVPLEGHSSTPEVPVDNETVPRPDRRTSHDAAVFPASIPEEASRSRSRPTVSPPMLWSAAVLTMVVLLVWAFAPGLRRTASASPRPVVLGVLPFFSDAPLQDDAETLREQAVDALASLPGCEIRSTRQLEAVKEEPLDSLAKRLHLDLFLSGRLHFTGDEYHLDLELMRSADSVHLGSLHYHGARAQLGEVPDRIASDLAPTLKKTTGQMQPQYLLGGTTNAPAYELAFAAQTSLRRRTTPEVEQAVRLYNKALAVDDHFAKAWSGLAESYLVLATANNQESDFTSAKDAAGHALSLEPHNAQAHSTLGLALLQHDWQAGQARANLTAATTESPGLATNYLKLAVLLTDAEDFSAAEQAINRAHEIDPDWPVVYGTLMHVHIMSRQYRQAIQDATTLVRTAPNWGRAHEYLGWAYWYAGQHEAAVQEWRHAAVLDKDAAALKLQTAGAAILQSQGVRAYSLYVIQQHGDAHEAPGYVAAEWYAFAGNPKGTLDELDHLVQTRNPEALKILVNPAYDFVRTSPRFSGIERYMQTVLAT